MYQIVQDLADAVDVLPVSRHTIRIFVKDIPSMGYKTLKVVPKYHTRAATPINMLCGINTMENEYLKVKINSNGTLKVTEKETGKEYDNILRTQAKTAAHGSIKLRKLMRNIQLLMNRRL